MTMRPPCGQDCPNRSPRCHGRRENGSWICLAWGEWQDAQKSQRDQSAAEVRKRDVQREYLFESKARFQKWKQHGHGKGR